MTSDYRATIEHEKHRPRAPATGAAGGWLAHIVTSWGRVTHRIGKVEGSQQTAANPGGFYKKSPDRFSLRCISAHLRRAAADLPPLALEPRPLPVPQAPPPVNPREAVPLRSRTRGSTLSAMKDLSAKVLTFDEVQELVDVDTTLQSALEKVAALDFCMLKRKLVEEKGWTPETVDEVEDLYRKYLALNLRYPEQKICPTGPIDEFWHAHILDTEAYARDCEALFGQYLHHFPYFGMRGPEDRQDLESAFGESVDLFIRHFGIDPTAGDAQARSCRPQRCP